MLNPHLQAQTLDRLSRWSRFKPSLCRGCWAGCCRLPVEASIQDLIRIGLISEDEAQGSLKKVAKRLFATGKIKSIRYSSGLVTLAQQTDGRCVFLDTQNLCSIYDLRPQVCRKFPEIGPRPGYCPALHPKSSATSKQNKGYLNVPS